MENQIFRDVNTGLDLNGPILSITQQPESVSGIGTTAGSTGGGSVELVGIATASFPVGPSGSVTQVYSASPSVTGGSLSDAASAFDGSSATWATLTATTTSTESSVDFVFPTVLTNVTKIEGAFDLAAASGDTRGRYNGSNGSASITSSGWKEIYSGGAITVTSVGFAINQNTSIGTTSDVVSRFRVTVDGTAYILINGTPLPDQLMSQAINQGTIAYQWHKVGGIVVDGDGVTGSATTTLTFTNLITPDDGGQYYFTAEYVPTYSGVGNPRLGSGYQTGNASNEPIQSEIATLSVIPMIEVIAQPSSITTIVNQTASFNVNANLTDNTYTDDLQYQWVVDGVEVDDGTFVRSTATFANVNHTFTSNGSCTIPAGATDVRITLAGGSGGHGGGAWAQAGTTVGTSLGGLGGKGRIGTFTLLSSAIDRTLEFHIGSIGNSGTATGSIQSNTPLVGGVYQNGGWGGNSVVGAGAGGGNSTGGVAAGGGGGGGGATGFIDSALGTDYIAIAGGGGGGGGSPAQGTNGVGAQGTFNGDGTQFRYGSVQSLTSGRNGSTGAASGGGGAGGADVNVVLPETGQIHAGGAGGDSGSFGFSGTSVFDNTQVSLGNEDENYGNGYAYLSYVGEGDPIEGNIIVSGSKTPSLTLSCDTVGVSTVRCKISSVTASNSPHYTDQVNFAVLNEVDNGMLNVEEIIGDETTANLLTANLVNGEYVFSTPVTDGTTAVPHTYVFYSPDRDMEVEMDLYGGKGEEDILGSGDPNAKTETGEGGYSRIRFTMEKNVEYVIAGLIPEVNTPFIYNGSRLIAVVGGGGGGGYFASGRGGGAGGGIGVAGEDGKSIGGGSGRGGAVIAEGTMSDNGIFGSLYSHPIILNQGVNAMQQIPHEGDSYAEGREGGRTISCAKGVYWAQQGKGACEDLGNIKFRLEDGTEVTNTSDTITRGFKAGYSILETAGWGQRGYQNIINSNGGNGGNGATGGQGGVLAGGGGGSGYTDGSVTVVSTRQGGSTFAQARVVLRLSDTISTPLLDGLVKDDEGRMLILSSTNADSPNNLTKRSVVEVGSNSCVNDQIWRYILDLARDGTNDYRLAVCAPNGNYGTRVKIAGANPRNIWRMMNANQLTLRDSLTGWVAPNSIYPENIGYANRLVLAWDETTGRTIGGMDYSLLWWVNATPGGWGYYGGSSNSFFTPTVYHQASAEWWLLPPGVPDF